MATHSSVLAWKITQTEESGSLQQHLGITGLVDFQHPRFSHPVPREKRM